MRIRMSYPLRLTLLYAIFGGLWIISSDQLTAWMFPNPQVLLQINTYKGWFFIIVTATLFYLELNREYSHIKQATAARQESEQRYQTLARISPVGIFQTNAGGATTYVNPKWCAISGLTAEQALGYGWLDAVHPDDREKLSQAWQASTQSQRVSFSDYRFVHPDGTMAWVMGRAVPEINAENEIIGYVGTITDITERKQAEEALRLREFYLTAILENQPGLVWLKDVEGHFLTVNQAFADSCGKASPADLVGKTDLDIWPRELAEKYRTDDASLIQNQAPKVVEELILDRGQTTWFETFKTPILDDQGAVIGTNGFSRNITERKLAEQELQASENKYRILIENIQIGVVAHAPDTSIIFSNFRASQLLGLTPDQMHGKLAIDPAWGFIREDGARMPLEEYPVNQALAAEAPIVNLILGILRPDREAPIWVQCSAYHDLDLDGKLQQVVVTFVDITARKQAEVALQKSEARMVSAIRAAGLCLYEEEGAEKENRRMTFFDAGMRELLGIPADQEHRARDYWIEHIHPDDLQNIMIPEIAKFEDQGENLVSAEYRYLNEKRGVIWFRHVAHAIKRNHKGEVLRLVGAIYNVTERKQAEEKLHEYSEHLEYLVEARTQELRAAQEQLLQQERLSVLGRLASGVAHELRNPLGVISNAVYFLKLILPDANEKVREYLDILTDESQTASKLAANLLNYSNIQTSDRYPVAALELVNQTLAHHPAPAGITVHLDIPPDLPQIYVDTHQIVQVLDNLVLNAYQSMLAPEGTISGGKLTISARRKGNMVAIAIRDAGEGIQPENFSRLFEPLFSTKPRGIGLGLPISQKLAEVNGGKIEVESEVGKGSTFMVYLPIKIEVQA